MPYTHRHECICGKIFWCRYDILPFQDSRAICKEWTESVCDDCLANMHAAQGNEVLLSFIEVAADPSAAVRCKNPT